MSLTFASMIAFGQETVLRPRGMARRTMEAGLTTGERWTAFAVVLLLSVVAAHVFLYVAVPGAMAQDGGMLGPLGTLVLQAVVLLVIAAGVTMIGRGFGGTGRFGDALILVALLQAMLVALQVLQFLTFLVLPPLSTLLGWGAVVLMLWLLTNFTAELHGFRSLLPVTLGLLGAFFALAVVLGFVLVLLGVQMEGI